MVHEHNSSGYREAPTQKSEAQLAKILREQSKEHNQGDGMVAIAHEKADATVRTDDEVGEYWASIALVAVDEWTLVGIDRFETEGEWFFGDGLVDIIIEHVKEKDAENWTELRWCRDD